MFTSFIAENDAYNKPAINLNTLNFNVAETPITLFNPQPEHDIIENIDDTMKIYLRLRPLDSQNLSKESPFNICDAYTISANPPEQSISYKNLLHGYGKGFQKFSFSKVFNPISLNSTQENVFNETTKSFLIDFLKGNDRLLFTYGTTSSGKTHTMNGTKLNPGIIPRALFYLFKCSKLSNNPSIMPVDFADICQIKRPDCQKLLKDKNSLLKLSEKESSEILNAFINSDFIENKENEQTNHSVLSELESSLADNSYETTFWISYTEIYNEFIYDLLDPVTTSAQNGNNNNKLKRPILDIRTARNGGSYVKGLKSYPVYTAEEAYRLLLVGRRNQMIGATKLNQNSSRSHTILTIRAVRTYPGSEYLTKVCNFSFCDLAGSERTDKAQTTGLMQKEASNINSSLLALARCIDVLKYNQTNKNAGAAGAMLRIVPYRDSKLTRLFQTYLGGNGKAAMVVCVNQDGKLFDETMQVLKFSALAKKVVLFEKEKPAIVAKPIDKEGNKIVAGQRPSLYRRLGMKTPRTAATRRDTIESILAGDDFDCDETIEMASDEEEEEEDEEQEYEEEYDVNELLDIIERLKTELIAVKKDRVASEAKLRETLNNEWSKTIMQMERDNTHHIQRLRDETELLLEKRARNERNKVYSRLKKRRLQPEYELSDDSDTNEDRETRITQLETDITELENQLKESQEETAEARETVEILIQEKEQLQMKCRTLEFQVQLKSQPREHAVISLSNNVTNLSIMDMSCSSEQSDRFSTLTRNHRFIPAIATDKVHSNGNDCGGEYDTMEYKSSPEASPKRDNNNNPSGDEDRSFLRNERDCAIDELSQLVLETERKTAEISELQQQLESIQKKIVSREKSIEKYIEKEKEAGKMLDGILCRLQVEQPEGSTDIGKVKRKLKLLSRAVQRIQNGLMEALGDHGAEEDEQEEGFQSVTNRVIARVTQLDQQLQAAHNQYRKLIAICNRCIIDKVTAVLESGDQWPQLSVDTPLSVVTQTFRAVWKAAIDAKVESFGANDNQDNDHNISQIGPNRGQ